MGSVLWKGFGFGVTSGVITTLGVIIGLHAGTHSKLAVLAGIVVLAISDALSDAMGIHVSEEAEMEHTSKELWKASFFTFISKLIFTLTFAFPIAFFELYIAMIVSVFWGIFLITLFNFYMAKSQKQKPYKVIIEHVFITVLVVLLTHYIGDIIYEIIHK